MDPFIICCKENENRFSQYATYTIDAPKNKFTMVSQSLGFSKTISQIMNRLQSKFKNIELLIPAFHPWNNFFLSWANSNLVNSSLVIHDFYTHKGESSMLIEALQRKAMTAATRVIFLSNFVKQQALKALDTLSTVVIIPHPIIDAGVENTLPYNPSPNILFLGRVVEYKGINLLIEAVQDIPINKLTIAGKQTGLRIDGSTKLNIIDKYLSAAKIAALLESHELLVLPYLEASQSGILTLGISARMVMLVSAVGGLSEQLDKDMAVWVEPTVQSIREGLISLMSNEETYSKVKTNISKLSA